VGFFSDLLGKSQKKAAAKTSAQAKADLKSGYKKARTELAPMAERGAADDAFYRGLLGLDGADARSEAQGVITSDPLWTGELGQNQNAMLRHLNARGSSGSGRALLAGQRVLAQQYGNWMDRYRQRSVEGRQAQANLANLEYGYGASKAGQTIQGGNAFIQAANSGVNNILGIAGLGVDAYTAGRKVA